MVKLTELYEIYKKWVSLESTDRLDIGLAIRLIAKTTGTRVWLIIIGASGDFKTEQLMALTDNDKDTKVLMNLTSKTLVNGSNKFPDLVPKLRDKCILIYDMAQLLKLHPNEKAEVWAQLRDLYDGFAGKCSGMGKDIIYKDLNITLLGASTPAIDTQLLIFQDLGTRELIWRCSTEDKVKLADKIWDNENKEDLMRSELKEVTNKFLSEREYDEDLEISPFVKVFLETQAVKLSYLRASAQVDSYTGDLINSVCPEKPTRILKQLKRIYVGIKSLDPDYSDSKAFDIIKHVVDGSSVPLRLKILEMLSAEHEYSTYAIAERFKVGYKTAYTQLNILWNLNLIHRFSVEAMNFGRPTQQHTWKMNGESDFIRSAFCLGVPDDVQEVFSGVPVEERVGG